MSFIGTVKTGFEVFGRSVEKKAPTLAIAFGLVMMVAGAVSAWEEAPKAEAVLKEKKEEKGEALTIKETGKEVLPYIWKPIALTTVGGISIIAGHRASLKRIAVLSVAYQLAEEKLEGYADAVKRTVGEKKAMAINDTVAKDHITQNPVKEDRVIVTGGGDCLCYDSISGRYFRSNIEKIRQAENRVNKLLLTEFAVSVNEFYEEIGLAPIKMGEDLGWNQKELGEIMEIAFSSQLTESGEPCLVLEYSVAPTRWYMD